MPTPDLTAAGTRLRLRRKRSRWLLFALVAFAGLLAFTFQGSRGIWGPDEGRYANVALEMIDSGDWLVPRRHAAHPQFGKPPMSYWAVAGSVGLFGRNEWTLRLPGSLAFVGIAALVLSLSRRLTPQRTWLPPVIFATTLAPFVAVNLFTTDMLLTLFHTFGAYAFVRIWHARDPQSAWRFGGLLGLAFGLAFLTRGLLGLLPLLGFVVFARFSGLIRHGFLKSSFWIAFGAVALPWYLAILKYVPEQFGAALGEAMLGGAGRGSVSDIVGGYLPLLALGSLPWAFVLFLKGGRWRHDLTRVKLKLYRQVHQERFFLWTWLGAMVLGVLLLHPQEPLTLLPLFVPFALLIGKELETRSFGPVPQGLLGAWVLVLLAIKGGVSGMNHPKDTRELAAAVRAAHAQPVSEVTFFEEPALYGLRYYLDAPIERVALTSASPDPKIDRSFAEAARERRGGRIWITSQRREDALVAAGKELGLQARLLTRFGRYAVWVLEDAR